MPDPRFMSTTLGFRYLYAADYIDREMESWFHVSSCLRPRNVSLSLSGAKPTLCGPYRGFPSKGVWLYPSRHRRGGSVSIALVTSLYHLLNLFIRMETILPPHFYGVMAKTELGCQVLQEKGHFSEFAQFIRRHGLESEDQDLILKLKSVLWAVVSRASCA